jgi:hypothetical protein
MCPGHGAFRFRQYLKGAKADDGPQPDNDLRELEFKKNQYGPRGKNIVLRYQNGLFLPEGGVSGLDKLAREAKTDQLFLDLLRRFAGQGRNVSQIPTAPTFAPAAFCKEADARALGLRKPDFDGNVPAVRCRQDSRRDVRPAIPPLFTAGSETMTYSVRLPVQLACSSVQLSVRATSCLHIGELHAHTRAARSPHVIGSRTAGFRYFPYATATAKHSTLAGRAAGAGCVQWISLQPASRLRRKSRTRSILPHCSQRY